MPTLQTHNGYPLWRYIPSLPAAIVFAAIFGLLTAAHCWRLFRHRMWFCIPFIVGGFFEVIGYAGRAAAYDATGKLIPYVIQSIFLLIAPILFAASLYMTLSRVIRSVHGEAYSMIAPRWLTRIFVFGDVFSFIVQSSGAGLRVQAGSKNSDIDPNLGSNVIVGGLVLQIVIFAIYIVTAVRFHSRFKKDPAAQALDIPWEGSLTMIYLTSTLIILRNIYRVVEYGMGSDGYLLGHEWPTYVFDAALMMLTMMIFFWRYPSQLKTSTDGDSHEMKPRSEQGEGNVVV
ncbi:RTA1 like protein-domain-containing protein [Thelonectria olida]|uniref:RTA1 like protein-domain-containing protein n=1 Tax=Thelonectria olida TaxID=1576542 RepID=A0A9P9AXW8_9HYPO|nr:RTA1 like protein-domain-containing protein [Thelonectria olida]